MNAVGFGGTLEFVWVVLGPKSCAVRASVDAAAVPGPPAELPTAVDPPANPPAAAPPGLAHAHAPAPCDRQRLGL